MKEKTTAQKSKEVSILLSTEHAEHASDVEKCFQDLDVSVSPTYMRNSAEELPMQILISLSCSIVGNAFCDLLKIPTLRLDMKEYVFPFLSTEKLKQLLYRI